MESARTVHGTVVPRVELEHIIDLLSNMSLSERQGVAAARGFQCHAPANLSPGNAGRWAKSGGV